MNYHVEGYTNGRWWSFYGSYTSFGVAENVARSLFSLWGVTKARVVNVSHSFVVEVDA